MSNYYIYNGNVVSEEYLAHHGVKGMKWGVRRYQKKDGSLTPAGQKRYADDLSEKKAAYKDAKKAYNKSFNKAYNKAAAAYSPIKKHRQANDERWNDAANKAEALNKAKSEYKQAKKKAKELTPEQQAARRKKAVTVGVAVAGTAVATYGAYKLSQYVKGKNVNAGKSAVANVMKSKSYAHMTSTEAAQLRTQAVDYAKSRGFQPSGDSHMDLLSMLTYLAEN